MGEEPSQNAFPRNSQLPCNFHFTHELPCNFHVSFLSLLYNVSISASSRACLIGYWVFSFRPLIRGYFMVVSLADSHTHVEILWFPKNTFSRTPTTVFIGLIWLRNSQQARHVRLRCCSDNVSPGVASRAPFDYARYVYVDDECCSSIYGWYGHG